MSKEEFTVVAAPATLRPRAIASSESPWLGLSSFTEETRAYFFGRAAELQDLYERIVHKPLTVLFGQSGLGKTSLLQAALVPRLREQGYLPVPLRLEYTPAAPPLERQVIRALYAALYGHPALSDEGPADGEKLWLLFHDPQFGFTGADGRGPDGGLPVRPVFLFDQFEEIFTLGERPERRPDTLLFRDALACLVENRVPESVRRRLENDEDLADRLDYSARPAKVLLTLREDFLHLLERWRRQVPSLMDNRFELRLLTGLQALQAVVEPGKLRGPDRPPVVSEETGAAIVRFVARSEADVPLAEIDAVPPLLSLICSELNGRRFDANGRLIEETIQPDQLRGRSEDILADFYRESFQDVPANVRRLVEDRLLSADGFRESLALDSAHRILENDGLNAAEAGAAIGVLVDRRLLVVEERGGVRRVELTHDVLTGVARASRDRRAEIEAAELARQRQTAAEAQAAKQRRQVRRARLVVAGLTVLAVVSVGALLIALLQSRKAARALSASVTVEAERLVRDGDAGKALAYLAYALKLDARNTVAANRIISILTEKSFALPLTKAPQGVSPTEDQYFRARFVEAGKSAPLSPDASAPADGEQKASAPTVVVEDDKGKAVTSPLPWTEGVSADDVAMRDDRNAVAITGGDSVTRMYNLKTGELVGTPFETRSPGDPPQAIFSPDGSRLWLYGLSASRSVVRNVATGKEETPIIHHRSTVGSVRFRGDGLVLASTCRDATSRLWNALTGTAVTEPIQGQFDTLSRDGAYLLSSAKNDPTCCAVLPGAAVPRTINCGGTVSSIAFSPDGRFLATASQSVARIWDVRTGLPATGPMVHAGRIEVVVFSPDGRRIATACEDKTARLWESASGKPVGRLEHDDAVRCVAFSPDGVLIATGTDEGALRIWRTADGAAVTTPIKLRSSISSVRFSADGSKLVTSELGSGIQVWDVKTAAKISEPHTGWTWQARFSRDGQRILAGISGGDCAAIFPIHAEGPPNSRAKTLATFPHLSGVLWADFSPDERRVVTASLDGTACIWDAATGRRITEPIRHEQRVDRASFSPDGAQILTASRDGTARVWDAASGRPVIEPIRHPGGVFDAAFSPDGRFIATAGADGRVIIADRIHVSGTAPAWLATLAEAVGGFDINDAGITEVKAKAAAVLADTRQLAEADDSDAPVAQWARWFFSSRADRCLSPFGKVTPREQIAQLLADGTLLPLEEAVGRAPDNPALLASLGEKLRSSDRERADFLTTRAHELGGKVSSAEVSSATSATVIAPDDLAQLRNFVGREVTVEGKAMEAGQNRPGTIRYLNFIKPYQNGVALVFFVKDAPEDFTEEKISAFVGKTVRVHGTVAMHNDTLQIRIGALSQVDIVSLQQ